MKRRALILSTLMAAVVVFSGCSSSPTSFMSAPDVDFSAYKTFGFIEQPKTDEAEYETLVTSYLKSAVKAEMEKRGFSYSEESPQTVFNFSMASEEKIRTHTAPSAGLGFGYDPYFDVYYDSWGMHHQTYITQYTEGRLNIDWIDTTARKLVWQGQTKGKITKKALENPQQTLNDAVEEIFTVFPIQLPEK